MFRYALALIGLVLAFGTMVSRCEGDNRNFEGDGLEPTQTLVARALGFERDQVCWETNIHGGGWVCNPFEIRLRKSETTSRDPRMVKVDHEDWGIVEYFVAYSGMGFELFFGFILLGWGLSDKKFEEEAETNEH